MSTALKHPSLSVLIPAAGGSERLGRAKQLVRYKGRTLVQNAVSLARSLSPLEIIVVTGSQATTIQESLQGDSVSLVDNPDWSMGMGGSIARGASAVNRESEGLMILLCDQWRIEEEDLQNLARKWHSDPTRIVVSEAGGQLMPPVIFPLDLYEKLRGLQGDHGARRLFKAFPERLTALHIKNAAFDLDTQDQMDAIS